MSSVVISGDTSGQITLAAPAVSGTNTITLPAATGTMLTTAGGQTITGNTTVSGTVVMGSPFTMRNKIINGAMVIDQRNAGASATIGAGNFYTLDRWYGSASQASKFSVQQNSGSITPPVGFKNYLGVVSSSAYTVGTSEAFGVRQAVEGFNVADLAWGTASALSVTLSFWVRSSLTGTFGGCVFNAGFNRSYVFSYSIPSANTWTYINITIPGDTSGTWATDNTVGLQINFSIGTGSSSSTTAGSWNGALYLAPTSSVSVVGTNGATFYITGVQLEIGTAATPFEYRNYQQELAMCMRYYQKTDALWGTASGGSFSGTYLFPTPMRASPSLGILSNGAYTALGITDYVLADYNQSSANISIVNGTRVSSTAVSFTAANFSGLTNYRYYGTKPNETAFMTLSAEL